MAKPQPSPSRTARAFRLLPVSLLVHGLLLASLGMVTFAGRDSMLPIGLSLASVDLTVPELRFNEPPPPPATPTLEPPELTAQPAAHIADSPDQELEAINRELDARRESAMRNLRPLPPFALPAVGADLVRTSNVAWLPAHRGNSDGQGTHTPPPASSVSVSPAVTAAPLEAPPAPKPTPPAPQPEPTAAARLVSWSLPPALRGRYTGSIECRIAVDAEGTATSVEFVTGTGDDGYDRMIRAALLGGQYAPAMSPSGPVASVLLQHITVR